MATTFRELLTRLRDWMRRDDLDAELTEELRFHRESLARDARSESDVDGAQWAARRLGNVTGVREEARERWSLPWLDHLQQDVRYALRGLRRSPGFTATVVVTLALGVGANATMFGVIDQLMVRPFPLLREPGEVHRVYLQATSRERVFTFDRMPYTRYLHLAEGTRSFAAAAAFTQDLLAVGEGESTRELAVAAVSASFWDFFAGRPAAGRFFDATEDVVPVGSPVVVLSAAFWRAEYGGRDVVGETVRLGDVPLTIIGVAPEGFVGVSTDQPPAMFIPITAYAGRLGRGNPEPYWLGFNWDLCSMLVRRKPGVSAEAATADLTAAFVRSREAQRALNPRVVPVNIAQPRAVAGALRPAGGPGAGLESRTLRWVAGVAAIVLLIACANMTNLQLARTLRRRREFAMRRALGVRLGRLVRQAFTESLLLGLFGCVAGVVLAEWGGAVLRALLLPPELATGVVTDWRTLTVALACALVAGIVTGVAPAILAARDELAPTLRAGARAGTYQRSALRTTLLVTQGALSVLLLIGAALFVRSLVNVRSLRLGYDPEPVLIARVNFRAREDSALRVAVLRSTLERARGIPGVEAAARANNRPFATNTELLYVPGVDSVQRLGRFVTQVVTPDYFSVVGTRLLRGRPLTEADDSRSERVMVASEAMARVLWPGQDALGKCVRVGGESRPCTHVVGIAEDAAYYSLTEGPWLAYYVPVEQQGPHWGENIVLRIGGGRATEAMERVRRELQRALPADVYVTVRGFDEYIAPQRRTWLLGATMFVTFGGLALLVAAVGLYGVIGYNVAQRMHELGVRVALGARAPHIVRLVVGQGVAFAAGGVAIGLALALIVSAWVQPLLFRQSARDPVVYGVVAAAMVLVAVLASLLPSLRAVRADPNTALRTD